MYRCRHPVSKKALLTFDGTAGQRISANAVSTFNGCWNFGLFKPDGTAVVNTLGCGSGFFIEPQTLPVTGTYTLVIDPSGAAVQGQATVNLYEVTDVTGAITINGPSVNVSLPTPGQKALLTFDGTAGQRISANAVSTFNSCWNFGLFKPDGTAVVNTLGCGSGFFIEPQTLPVTGTYTLVIDPSGAGTGSATVNVYDVVDVTGSVTIDGPGVSSTITTPGQTARLAFDATERQRVSVTSSSSNTTCWTLAILKPDGSQLTSVFGCGSSIFIEPQTLPVSGSYTVLIDPSGAGTGQTTVNLHNVVDVTGTLTLGGPAVNVSITVPGQNASFTFSGTTGQQATVRFSGSTIGCVTVALLKPDRTLWFPPLLAAAPSTWQLRRFLSRVPIPLRSIQMARAWEV